MTDMNMNERPVFLPFLGDTRGGTAEIDWYMQYMTTEEMETFPEATKAWEDGWVVQLTGTATLDMEAAMAVIGLTSAGFDDFDTWWAANGFTVEAGFSDWMSYEGNERLDIYNMYEYAFSPLRWQLDAEKVGDKIVLDYNHISWGMESLMTRWMRDAFTRDHEWYLEDMEFKATIGPEMTTLDVDTAIVYAQYAYETAEDAAPCWMWEALVQDYVHSNFAHPDSEYDIYADKEYLMLSPGSPLYGDWMTYDYAPGIINLTEGETLRFTWPGGEEEMFYVPGPELIPTYGSMTITNSEPFLSDFPGQVSVDLDNRELVYTGPIDMWTWSKDQSTHEGLESEWDRLGVLPYGIPTVEFKLEAPSEATWLAVEGVTSPIDIGVSSEFTVTVMDQFNDPYPGYLGIVTFESTDLEADLPGDYTFLVGDAGVKTFDVTFATPGMQSISATDVDDETITGEQVDIEVVQPLYAHHFDLVVSDGEVKASLPAIVTVTVKDQNGDDFPTYVGEVEFSSTDALAVIVPDPYTFLVGDEGVATFEVTFMTAGLQTLNATDTSDPALNGTLEDIDVLAAPEAASFELTGIPNPALTNSTAHSVTVTVYDQYGDQFPDYLGTVTFTSDPVADIVLPANYEFQVGDDGVYEFVDAITFERAVSFDITCEDTVDSSIFGTVTIMGSDTEPVADHFIVEGIVDMLTYEVSGVTVTMYDDFDTVYELYEGTIEFTTDAPAGTFTLPGLTTFDLADEGTITLSDAISFTEGGTFSVTVTDTSDGSLTGAQTGIVIEDRMPTTLEISDEPSSIAQDFPFSLTVSVMDQYGDPCIGYEGTVVFESTDGSAVLPVDGSFAFEDDGVRVFADIVLVTPGDMDITVTDDSDGTLTDTVTIAVIEVGQREVEYRIYDLLDQPFGEWWEARLGEYGQDIIVSEGENANAFIFLTVPSLMTESPGILYAPYRYAIDASYVPTLTVDTPEFMPVRGTPQEGAEVSLDIYSEYLYDDWWHGYWYDMWDSVPGFWGDKYVENTQEGYLVGTIYNVTMNREAAYEYLLMPTDTDPEAWYATNQADYESYWTDWIVNEGCVRLDIAYGYEDLYYDMKTTTTLVWDEAEDEVTLTIGHVNWGYEVLLTRWLTETQVSPNHEPYYEDFSMSVEYGAASSNLTMDSVAQYSMHAVKANGTADGAAWVWEPNHIDYCDVVDNFVLPTDLPSEYAPYADHTYQSWNTGDTHFSLEAPYEYTPYWFNLSEGETLVFEMPDGDMLGYDGVGLDGAAYGAAFLGDTSAFEAISTTDSASLGYYVTGGPDLSAMESGGVITMVGPLSFNNLVRGDGTLYHGAPWIEVNVGAAKALAAEVPIVEGDASTVAAGSSAASEIVSLVAVMMSTVLLVAAVVLANRRR